MSAEAKKTDAGMPGGGAPGTFEPRFCATAKVLCGLGATDPQLAEAFGVTLSTIKQWQAKFEDFSEACRLGKEAATGQVRRALLKRAMGYTYTTEKIVLRNGLREVIRTEHHVPPDINAAKLWLLKQEEAESIPTQEQFFADLRRQLSGSAIRPKED